MADDDQERSEFEAEWNRFSNDLAVADGNLAFLIEIFQDNAMVRNALEDIREATRRMGEVMAEQIVWYGEREHPPRRPPNSREAPHDIVQLAQRIRERAGPVALVVDDDDTVAHRIAAGLARYDFEPTVANSFGEVFSPLLGYGIAIVDLDLQGERSGLDVIRGLKASESPPIVLAHSGCAAIYVAVGSVRHGADNFLLKPATVEEILVAIGDVLGYGAPEFEYRPMTLERVKTEVVQRVYRDTGGNTKLTATLLGIDRKTVRRYLNTEDD